ncbi:MAG: hypothetical protein JRN56_02130 [Nitrososphaerota archaeon]|nr:hypothetical protein [Nitrososphaerota archaeon]MDG6912167.1 hypothetical protein [Nitrososphaerota archaeon]MDG6952296.1 hypothetical protein [Nitrososphaerota archaeon]MDG6954942.1 hypothetical protein [Nitrososphaerota archaeon]MDG6971266.1 hypothetical protein [Nitrososphaerota archaeon]
MGARPRLFAVDARAGTIGYWWMVGGGMMRLALWHGKRRHGRALSV